MSSACWKCFRYCLSWGMMAVRELCQWEALAAMAALLLSHACSEQELKYVGTESRAGSQRRVGGEKSQPGVDKHHRWAHARESCWEHHVLPGQTQCREPSHTVACQAVQGCDKECSASGSHQDDTVVSHSSPGTQAACQQHPLTASDR